MHHAGDLDITVFRGDGKRDAERNHDPQVNGFAVLGPGRDAHGLRPLFDEYVPAVRLAGFAALADKQFPSLNDLDENSPEAVLDCDGLGRQPGNTNPQQHRATSKHRLFPFILAEASAVNCETR